MKKYYIIVDDFQNLIKSLDNLKENKENFSGCVAKEHIESILM